MKKILLVLVMALVFAFVAAGTASAASLKYRFVVPTVYARAAASGAGIPWRKCAFIKQRRIFGCKVGSGVSLFVTRPALNKYFVYGVLDNKIVKRETVRA